MLILPFGAMVTKKDPAAPFRNPLRVVQVRLHLRRRMQEPHAQQLRRVRRLFLLARLAKPEPE
jgi:hypothetical protein